MDDHTETLIELNSKLTQLLSGIDALTKNQERMCEDISKIKEAVYNPDEGLYARLRALEQWKESTVKIQWIMISGILMLAVKQIWETMMVS
jgi:peptidoglycan hydrolase CwlO-like protein